MTQYCYDYPMPSITVDACIFCCGHLLLIKRRDGPFMGCWALPGGFMNMDETLLQAVVRETQEETGLKISEDEFKFVGTLDDPERDSRGRVVSHVYSANIELVRGGFAKAGDDATELEWYNLFPDLGNPKLPAIAFDHEKIIRKAIKQRKGMNK